MRKWCGFLENNTLGLELYMYGNTMIKEVIIYREGHDTDFISASDIPGDARLFVCDCEEYCNELKNKGYAVAALRHENNKECPFTGIEYVIENIEELDAEDYDYIYRRIRGLPVHILETQRLLVRETTLEDLEQLENLYDDEEAAEYLEKLFEPELEREYQQIYIKYIYGFYDCGIWSLLLKNDDGTEGSLIGRMGYEFKDDKGTAELGFMLGKDYRRQGYALEAGEAVLKHAKGRGDIACITARVHRNNTGSNNLCEKLGMCPLDEKREGTHPESDYIIWIKKLSE